MIKRLLMIALILPLLGGTCSIKQDTSILSAVQANDLSLIFSGCSDSHRDGLILCRSSEGATPSTVITVTMPDFDCDRESCTSLSVIRKDGTIHPLKSFPEGETTAHFTLADVIGSNNPMFPSVAGPYRIVSESFYEQDGQEWKIQGVGIIYLLVLKPGYMTLGCGSPNMAWREDLGDNCKAEFSTKMRSAICGEKCDGQ